MNGLWIAVELDRVLLLDEPQINKIFWDLISKWNKKNENDMQIKLFIMV